MIFAHDYHILEALSESGALPTGDVAFLVNGCRDRSGSAVMSRALKALKAKGLVKPLDCGTPVVWLRTKAGSDALRKRNAETPPPEAPTSRVGEE